MPNEKRPHLAWTAAVVAALALLFLLAWSLWSRRGEEDGGPSSDPTVSDRAGSAGTAGPTGPSDPASGPESSAAKEARLRAALDAVNRSIEDDAFEAAAQGLAKIDERFEWSDEIGAVATRLSFREASYREALRPIEFLVESIVARSPDDDELFVRFSVEGVPVFASELLHVTVDKGPDGDIHPAPRSHFAVLRTSFALGVSLEIVEPAGMFGSEEVVFGPVALSPLPITQGGVREYGDTDGRIQSLNVRYRASAFEPGVHHDKVPLPPPTGASAPQLHEAIRAALGSDQLAVAGALERRLASEFPTYGEGEYIKEQIESRSKHLRHNRTTATFTIVELATDPRPDGDDETKLWANGGNDPSFYASVRTTDNLVLVDSDDEPVVPYLIPGNQDAPPAGNVLEVTARGEAPLILLIKDTSPRFSSRVVGTVDLPVTLSELPRGSGTIVVERNPHVLIQPGSEPNRIRRLLLRWKVQR